MPRIAHLVGDEGKWYEYYTNDIFIPFFLPRAIFKYISIFSLMCIIFYVFYGFTHTMQAPELSDLQYPPEG